MKKFFILVKRSIKAEDVLGSKAKLRRTKNSGKRGSELAQTVLITGIMVVVIATLFFPQIQSLFTTSMTKVSTWFNNVLNQIGAM